MRRSGGLGRYSCCKGVEAGCVRAAGYRGGERVRLGSRSDRGVAVGIRDCSRVVEMLLVKLDSHCRWIVRRWGWGNKAGCCHRHSVSHYSFCFLNAGHPSYRSRYWASLAMELTARGTIGSQGAQAEVLAGSEGVVASRNYWSGMKSCSRRVMCRMIETISKCVNDWKVWVGRK